MFATVGAAMNDVVLAPVLYKIWLAAPLATLVAVVAVVADVAAPTVIVVGSVH